jgi:hypothetical protein
MVAETSGKSHGPTSIGLISNISSTSTTGIILNPVGEIFTKIVDWEIILEVN